jgi:hypothetical protein
VEGGFCKKSTYSILYKTTSIIFLGPSQEVFQTSAPFNLSWCRINMRISLHTVIHEAAGVWEGGACGDPSTAHKHLVRWRSKDGGGGLDTPLPRQPRGSLFPLPTPSHDAPELFKAASNVFVAAEQALDSPEDLTGMTTAEIGLYTPWSG